jgi:carbonic anhydrase
MPVQKLVKGIHTFQKGFFKKHRELFAELAENGQRPETLFITCSDSRVLPERITASGPGELFLVRNVGNVIPRTDLVGGTAAAIEYAVEVLNVNHIVVCGHTKCGAIDAVLDPARTESLSYVQRWLAHTARVREVIENRYADLPPHAQRMVAVEENVLMQLENLRDYSFVEERLAAGKLDVSGWVFDVETGRVFDYDPIECEFLPIGTSGKSAPPPPATTGKSTPPPPMTTDVDAPASRRYRQT